MRRRCMWFCLLGIVVCVVWMYLKDLHAPPEYIQSEEITLQGYVSRAVCNSERTILYLSEVSDDGVSAEFSKNNNCIGVICYLQTKEKLRAGQFVVLKGRLQLIEGERNPGEFSFQTYYRARGYSHKLMKAELIDASVRFDPIRELLNRFAAHLDETLLNYLSYKDYGTMKAMLLGDKADLDETSKGLFQEIGIYHILAISGLHITFLGNLVYFLLRKIGVSPQVGMGVSLMILVLYVIMTGVSVSSVRAVIMFIICLGGKVFLRTYDMLTALSVAAFLTIWHNPYIWMDGGFRLSYLAVCGIAILYPALPGVNARRVRIIDSVWSGLATWMLTLPVIIGIYYEISLYSIPVNLLVLPSVSYVMLLGVGIVIFDLFIPIAAQLCANGCHIFLKYYDTIVRFATALPFGSIVTGKPEVWQSVVFLSGVVGISFLFRNFKRRHYLAELKLEQLKRKLTEDVYRERVMKLRRKYALAMRTELFLLAVLLLILIADPQGKGDEITVLDVGQGDAICMNFGEEGVYMIDGGSSSRNTVGEDVIYPFLKSQGIDRIDMWFLTHPDADHVSAFLENEEKMQIRVEQICIPGVLWEEFKEIRQIADKNNIKVCVLFAGDVIQLKRWRIEVISPYGNVSYADNNAASMVLYVSNGRFSALMMGDAGTEAQEAVFEEGIQEITFLKVAHHGSAKDSNTREFLQAVSARIAVISCARNNVYGHPHAETLQWLEESGSDIYRTDLQGAICIRIGEESVVVEPYLAE